MKKKISYPANLNKADPSQQFQVPVQHFQNNIVQGLQPELQNQNQLIFLLSQLQDQLQKNIRLMHDTTNLSSGPQEFQELSAKNEVIYAQIVQVEELINKQEYIKELERQQTELRIKQEILNRQMQSNSNDYIDVSQLRENN